MPVPLQRVLAVLTLFFLGGCASVIVDKSPESGMTAIFNSKPAAVQEGIASWYKDKRTASGERFDATAMAAAHRQFPFGSNVRVIDLKTHNSVIVRINDRGPYKKGRIIDLTMGAARKLGIYDRGLAKVRIELLKQIPLMAKPNLRPSNSPSHSYTYATNRATHRTTH